MVLPKIVGHEHVFETFRRALGQRRLASTFLFVGPPGIGKWTTALSLAQALLCETTPPDELQACQTCPGCQQVAAWTHPDLLLVQKPDDKNFIPIELFIGDREHRMREGLCHEIALKPFRGGRRIAIIDDADYLNQEGANCLLKTLEEPPADSLIILIGTSQQRQLPTIRSRCQIIRFQPLTDVQVATLLADANVIEDRSRIATLVMRARAACGAHWSCPIRNSTPPALPCCSTSVSRTLTRCPWPSTSTSLWKPPARTRRPDVPGCGRLCWRPPSSIDVSCGN